MDVMRTGCSVLGTLEPELTFNAQRDKTDRLLARSRRCAVLVPLQPRQAHRLETDDDSIGGHFLHLLHGKKPSDARQGDERLADPVRRARVQRLDLHRRVCLDPVGHVFLHHRAIGALRGPHGGANEAALNDRALRKSTAEAPRMLERKDKIMGFGHPSTDPTRNEVIKGWSKAG
jgi:2-methylcitrate synthase